MLLLGIDLGTTGTKAVVVDDRGSVVASATREHPLSAPRPGWSEQDPETWWQSTCEAVKAALATVPNGPKRIAGIGLSGQMHGLVMVDADGEPLRPCILWNDQRSAPQCERIEREIGLEAIVRMTGNRMLPGFTAPKILWCREHEPELERRARTHLLPKDWLRFRLSETRATEVSDASGTLLFDCGRRCWSEAMLDTLRIDRATMPECAESTVVSARLSARAGESLGLRSGIPIVGGAGDQAASAIGSGIVREGAVSVTIGTSGVAFATCDAWRPSARGEVHAFCHAVPGRWHVMGVMLGCGGSLRWYRDTFAFPQGDHGYEAIVAEAATSQPGARGISFLPYLSGERCPHPDPEIRGALLGLDASHRRADVSRAVLEGITFGLGDNLDLIRGLGIPVGEVRLAGGGARSAFWQQLCADVFGCPVLVSRGNEGGALGVALLAGVGVGLWRSVDEACPSIDSSAERKLPVASDSLHRAMDRFRQAYPQLRPLCHPA
ncbi:MAG: xylulokinase [Phycisphaerae bacterium]|jgi:xylulokinase|nr:xylulokinase [Phycisphaerae bacterium]